MSVQGQDSANRENFVEEGVVTKGGKREGKAGGRDRLVWGGYLQSAGGRSVTKGNRKGREQRQRDGVVGGSNLGSTGEKVKN